MNEIGIDKQGDGGLHVITIQRNTWYEFISERVVLCEGTWTLVLSEAADNDNAGVIFMYLDIVNLYLVM